VKNILAIGLIALLAIPLGAFGDPDVVTVRWIRKVPEGGHAQGLAYPHQFDGCVIIAPHPRSAKDYERLVTLGHELVHCFDGEYHGKGRQRKAHVAPWGWGEWNRQPN
jgi:hypothetical protein